MTPWASTLNEEIVEITQTLFEHTITNVEEQFLF
jgi:hypothetical protein